MKIAIVGGGFFGCYTARLLERELSSSGCIDIFDRASTLMSGAAASNQARAHLGFHYPRSPETMRQTLLGFHDFVEEFSEYVAFPSNNLYAIHRDGRLTFGAYLAILDEFGLSYEICHEADRKYFTNPDDIEGMIRVGEGVIDVGALRAFMLSTLAANVFCNAVVSAIDADTGIMRVNGEATEPYDFIINTSYTNPNLGLPSEMQFDVKYESTYMALIDHPFGQDVALTIMDGDFVSLYPWPSGRATLSSVIYTPFRSFGTLEGLETDMARPDARAEQEGAARAILAHAKELIRLNVADSDILRVLFAPKCKLRHDDGDTRESYVRFHGRLAAVLAGKLDACRSIGDTISQYIQNAEWGTAAQATTSSDPAD